MKMRKGVDTRELDKRRGDEREAKGEVGGNGEKEVVERKKQGTQR